MNAKVIAKAVMVPSWALLLCASTAQAQFSLLHEFAGGGSDGSTPYGEVRLSGSTLYGMTYDGGDSNLGTVFKVNTDGSGFSLLHEFAGGTGDGSSPEGSLTLSGSTIYGMTRSGGDNDFGTVFKMNTDGSGYTLLREFAGGASDGWQPYGSLTVAGSTLYGMTGLGGSGVVGTVFKMNTDGTGFSLLHGFVGGGSDGARPYGDLLLSGSTLFGMTSQGGDSNYGTVFKVNTDGTGFTLLHEFAGGGTDGRAPEGSLTLDGSTLYGMTLLGGDSNLGTVFKVDTDGTGFGLLREFTGGGSDGSRPYGDLTLDSSILYGMTFLGGDSDVGTLFQMNTSGSGFSLHHEFAGGNSDGGYPLGSLTLSGTTFYGMTSGGGDSNLGTVFSYTLPIPEPSSLMLTAVGALGLLRRRRS